MDRATLDALAEYQIATTPTKVIELPNLMPSELALYDYLKDSQIRLEQERVPFGGSRNKSARSENHTLFYPRP